MLSIASNFAFYKEGAEGTKVRKTKSVKKIPQQSRNVGTKAVLTGYISVLT